jgi:hypothetical protein
MPRKPRLKSIKLKRTLAVSKEHGRLQGYLFMDTSEGMIPFSIDAPAAENLRDELDKFFKYECPSMDDLQDEMSN